MAERTVTVRLKAINDLYRKAMRESAADTASVTKQLRGLQAASGDLKDLGGQMTRNLTVPLVGAGLLANKLAGDFETTFAQMVGLANVPAAEIDSLRDSVMGLSAETARSPQELAQALYYIRSSGISAGKSLDVLKASAQAAAAGMGSAEDIAKAVGYAINAYGENNLSAAQATDILVAAIREGAIEAGELAPVMGTLIPTASALGIGFDQVAATMAVMSKNGANAAESATGLSAVMSTLLGTSEAGTALLESHGLSLAKLRDIASGPGGLVAVFRTLQSTFKGDNEALATIIPNIRALRTFMNVLAQDSSKVDDTLRAVTGSAGATAEAFAAVAKTDAFKQRQAIVDAKIALIELGATLAPLVTMLATTGAAFASAFGAMPDQLQVMTAGLIVLVAATGPLLRIGGQIAANFATISKVMTAPIAAVQRFQVQLALAKAEGISTSNAMKMLAVDARVAAASFAATVLPLVAVGYAVGHLVSVWQKSKQAGEDARRAADEFAAAMVDAGDAAEGAGTKIKAALTPGAGGDNQELLSLMSDTAVSIDDVTKAAIEGEAAVRALKDRLIGITAEDRKLLGDTEIINSPVGGGSKALEQLDALIAGYQRGKQAFLDFQRAQFAAGKITPGTFGVSPADIAAAEAALKTLPPAITETATAAQLAEERLKAMLDTFDDLYAQAFGLLDATIDYNDALADVGKTSEVAAGSTRNLVAEQRSAQKAAESVTKAQLDLAKAEAALVEARKGPTDREKLDANLGVREATLGVAEAQKALADASKRVTEERKKGKDGDVKGAQLALARASIALQKAQLAVVDAQAEQNDVMNSGAETSKKVTDAVDDVAEATLRLRDAQWQQEESQTQTVAGTGRVIDKQKELADQIDAVIERQKNLNRAMIEMGTPKSEVLTSISEQARAIQEIIDKYGDVNGKLEKQLELLLNIAIAQGLPATVNPETGWVYYELPKRAMGGSVTGGMPHYVGERGPEIFFPSGSGNVMSTEHARSQLSTPVGQLVTAGSTQSGGLPAITAYLSMPIEIDGIGKIAHGVAKFTYDNGGLAAKWVSR